LWATLVDHATGLEFGSQDQLSPPAAQGRSG